jgi:hypothetical protein
MHRMEVQVYRYNLMSLKLHLESMFTMLMHQKLIKNLLNQSVNHYRNNIY